MISTVAIQERALTLEEPQGTAVRRLVLFLFFLSGAAGLIYEVVWSRTMTLLLGSSMEAHLFVLSAYLGGLAAGNYLFAGRIAERLRRPLLSYGFLELAVAFACAAYPFAHYALAKLSSPAALWLGVSAALIVPTLLMGGTFPVIVRSSLFSRAPLEKEVGLLYGVNSAGAVVGALAGSLLFIQNFGLWEALLAGVTLSASAGMGAILLSLSSRGELSASPQAPPPTEAAAIPGSGARRLPYLFVFLTGFGALALEVCWYRFFALVLGSNLHSFTLMLAAFISGISLGGFAVRLLPAREASAPLLMRRLIFAQIAFSSSLALTLSLYPRLPYLFAYAAGKFQAAGKEFWLYQTFSFFFCFLLMFFPTFFSGLSLPLAGSWAAGVEGESGRGVGRSFASNLLGTILGTLLTGPFFLPLLGLRNSLLIPVCISAAAAALIAFKLEDLRLKLSLLLPAALVLLLLSIGTDWRRALLAAGPFLTRAQTTDKSFDAFLAPSLTEKILYHKDGMQGTVTVTENADGDRTLKINGKTDASCLGDLKTELLLGHLPMLLRPEKKGDPVEALCIGFGSGISAGAVLTHPGVRLDLVEISPEVIEAAPHFAAHNHDVLKNPACRLIVDDARHWVRRSRRRYDLILSEPSNPRVPETAALFSRDFFEQAAAHLAEDGLMVQWFHLYFMSDRALLATLRTFQSVFPETTIWHTGGLDIVLVGSRQSFAVGRKLLIRRMSVPAVSSDLARLRIFTPEQILVMNCMGARKTAAVTGPGILHTDFHPILEFEAAANLYNRGYSRILIDNDERAHRAPRPPPRRL